MRSAPVGVLPGAGGGSRGRWVRRNRGCFLFQRVLQNQYSKRKSRTADWCRQKRKGMECPRQGLRTCLFALGRKVRRSAN
jgi:hypothetical protein